jgi:transcription elongation factor Elf1
MSFEGYYQYLCEDGHYWILDVWETAYDDEIPKCPKCGKQAVWYNLVDQTNGEGKPVKLKVKKKINGYCSCCGKEHICEITYKIPK